MSIYYKEKPEYFNRAMQSIWDEQTLKPNEIVLVLDGRLTNELYSIINKWKKKLGNILKIVDLPYNMGLGRALNEGIKQCSYELIARMDTDDIALPYRFEKQIKIFKEMNIDVCSAWVGEFENDENIILSVRKVPEYHDQIVKFSKRRCPVNHPAVVYKKSVVEKVGFYSDIMWFEDYHLWVKLIMKGAKLYNIQEVLVKMRGGRSLIERRRGFKYAIQEIKLQTYFFKLGHINIIEFLTNSVVRFGIRLMPTTVVEKIYKTLRKL